MPISFVVTNKGPKTTSHVPSELLDLFQHYIGEKRDPFEHQAEVFKRVWEDNEEVFLAAGTAAGKTLAIAIPLFHKLWTGRMRKVLIMYPTIALMDDQRQVMDRLSQITQVAVSQIQGGMSRSELVAALNKQIILATPDAVYWFFRKNVKYSGLLLYGLALIDEFVLDEAHLFNGLMLSNFEHLWWRVKTLAGCLGKTPHLHILTATPTPGLKQLNRAESTPGKSKCSDVEVEMQPGGYRDRDQQFVTAINEALNTGKHKVLVVCNSARMAHQLFEKYRVNDVSKIPVEHRLKFGKVSLGDLVNYLEKVGIEKELIDELCQRLLREENIVLDDVPNGIELKLRLVDVVTQATEVLERQCWQIKRVLWEHAQRTGETWESLLNNRPLPCRIIAVMRTQLEQLKDVEEQRVIVDEWLVASIDKLANISQDQIVCQAKEFATLTHVFVSIGLDTQLARLLTKRLLFQMKADPEQLPARRLNQRPIYLRWLGWIVGKDKAERLREVVKMGIASGELEVSCRYVGLWKGKDVPVIVYSGSMAKHARTGLINVFSDLDRAILISTSAVEVGVDFHAEVLITEECEGHGFLQRFGRVGRHGTGSQVIGIVSGNVYEKFRDLDQKQISREDFSDKVVHLFPRRNYAVSSKLLNASHYLVNEQVGRIAERLNAVPALMEVQSLAQKLREAELQLGFGLRSTTPQITLRDGVTKDPFYLLRYVDDKDLRPADSPFEVARSVTWFTNLIFEKAKFNVTVDLEATLKASQLLIILQGGQVNLYPERGIGNRHYYQLRLNIPWSNTQPWYFILLHGDVYLSRFDQGVDMPPLESVRDAEGNLLFIPNQSYLFLGGWTNEEATRELLEMAGIANWEELHYDWERLRYDGAHGMIILEKITGACFAAYQELVNHVSRQVQK